MMARGLITLGLLFPGVAVACDCTTYPFMPNPPCYSQCVAWLTKNKQISLSSVKNLDPGVSVAIGVLRQKEESTVDFSSITNKKSLEREAAKIVPDKGGFQD